MSNPLVSIIIPTKNRVDLLREAINSVRRQTYSHWELVVVDDGSIDETVREVVSMGGGDRRIRLIERRSGPTGADACRNKGLRNAKGNYIVFLDSDDALSPSCLMQRVNVIQESPDLDFAVFQCEAFDAVPGDQSILHNIFTDEDDLNRLLRRDMVWQTGAVIWRREALERVGAWDEKLLSWQDWDLDVRAILYGLNYKKVARRDCYWRQPGKQVETIGLHSRRPNHLHNQEYLFEKIIQMFEKTDLLTPVRKNLLAGNYLHFAMLWEEKCNSRKDAIRVWRLRHREHLIGLFDYFRVKFYFELGNWPGGWRIRPSIRSKLGKWFPSLIGSQTMCCIPINEKETC